MSSNEFMGMLIASIVVLVGLSATLTTLIIKPIINLNKSITKLNHSIDTLNSQQHSLSERVSKHGQEIDANKIHLIHHDKDIENLKEKLK